MTHAAARSLLIASIALASGQAQSQPEYEIFAISLPGQANSNGQGISPSGNFVTGTSNNTAVLSTVGGGTVGLPALGSRPFSLAQAVNDSGVVVGTGATTFFGSSPLPLMWTDASTVVELPLPAGESLGRAFGVNNDGLAVGSVDGGSLEQAATFTLAGSQVIAETMPNGGVLRTAYAVNGAGRIVGQALDPTNAAVLRGFYIDPGDRSATDIGALTALGHNSAIPFAVSSAGHIAGSSSFNAGVNIRPFIWTESGGMVEIPLLPGTTTGSARGVNADGWVVGNMSSATSIVFVYDGSQTYFAQDLIPAGSGWDLTTGTSNGAFGIADNGVITGRGLLNGNITGFIMVPVADCIADTNGDGLLSPADFSAWIAAFNAMSPECDQNGDSACTPADFSAWVANYNAGC